MNLGGVIPPMLSPVTGRAGDIDASALRKHTRRLVDAGVDGLFPCGSNGEFSSLTREQRHAVVETVVDASGSTPVLAGCGGTGVEDVRTLVEDAADAGADAAVVVTPYYLQTTQQGLLEFFQTVADHAPLPIFLYDIPVFTGLRLDPETVAELSNHGSIVGLKDSTGDLDHFDAVLHAVPETFDVFQGATTYAVPALDAGADGIVPGEANVVPPRLVEVYEAHEAGDRARSAEVMQEGVAPITRAVRSMPTIPAVKYLGSKPGPDLGPPLAPLPELSAEERRRLDVCYEEYVRPIGA